MFSSSLENVRKLLPHDGQVALDKHIITAHMMEWLQGRVYGWSDARKEPILHHVQFEHLETHSNCSTFECTLYVSTLSDGLQLWWVSGRYCFGWSDVQVSNLKEVASTAVQYRTAPKGTYPPFTNGSEGMYNLLFTHTVHAHVLQLVVYMLHTTAKKNCFNHLHPYIMTPLLKVFTFNSVFENICFPDCFGVCM